MPNSNTLLLKTKIVDSINATYKLLLLNLNEGNKIVIYSGAEPLNLTFDNKGEQIAFITYEGDIGHAIWNYSKTKNKSQVIIDDHSFPNNEKENIALGGLKYTKDDESLFFSLEEKKELTQSDLSKNVWGYKDSFLKSYFFGNYGTNSLRKKKYLSIVSLRNGEVNQLLHGNETLVKDLHLDASDSIIIIKSSNGLPEEQFITGSKITYSICYTRSGKKVPFETAKVIPLNSISLSPNLNYICYFDPYYKSYIIYDIKNNNKKNLTQSQDFSYAKLLSLGYPHPEATPIGISGWIKESEKVIINSTYDLWAFDAKGKEKPINLTGKSNYNDSIVFNIVTQQEDANYRMNQSIIISGFNVRNKNISFYKLSLKLNQKIEKLYEGPDYMDGIENTSYTLYSNSYIESKNKKMFLIKKERVNEAPNYFYTKDLKLFTPLSDLQPQKRYNWLRSQLHTYSDSAGNKYDGILYTPENYDSTSKHPLLIKYYESQSNLLNSFPDVELAAANFNIPIALSRGYLVFLPDIKSSIGYAGDGALKSVLAAVNYLSKYTWIDTSRIGISGHSFGGFETNYIVTHSNKFKAAISCAGISDFVSTPFSIWGLTGNTMQAFFQNGPPKMGKAIVDDKDPYLRNSPILFAKMCVPHYYSCTIKTTRVFHILKPVNSF